MTERNFVSYAQSMEDIRLWRALRDQTPGRYIDIGAWEPRLDSVSRGFYEFGWRGCHFEPHPVLAKKLREDRPDETVYEIALSDHEGVMQFFLVGDGGTSSGINELAVAASGPNGKPQQIEVPVTTLARHFASSKDQTVHWMKIDVEGMEADVLRGWDPGVLRPWVMVIEATRPMSRIPVHETFEHILIGADYLPAGFDGLNRYYVSKEHRELVDALADPVSIFDVMEGCELSDSSPFVHAQAVRLKRIESSWAWWLAKPIRAIEWRIEAMRKRK
jgi:FkbM family methyltransferase